MKTIGGYLELQLNCGEEYYPQLIALNTGRNALEYILQVRAYRKIYIPWFTCEVILEPMRKLGIAWQYYGIDKKMDPVINFELQSDECLLYTNYFGLKQDTVLNLSRHFPQLIVDNSQAFFAAPVAGCDTFYSCRKFFGVPDGAYLQINAVPKLKLKTDCSADRFAHLIRSIDQGIESGYREYVANNYKLSDNPIRNMSPLTRRLLSAIDYPMCRERRNSNFRYLHNALKSVNNYPIDMESINGPMVYPLLHPLPGLKKCLLREKIFVATYWPNVLDWTSEDMFEYQLCKRLVALPVDHRYTGTDMKRILHIIRKIV